VAGVATGGAAAAGVEDDVPVLRRVGVEPEAEELIARGLRGLFAVRAELARETLRDRGDDGRGDEERLNAHVDHTRNGGRRVVGVQRAEHKVTGQSGLDSNL